MEAWYIIAALPLVFGFIIGMAVTNGLIMTMYLEVDPENGGTFKGRKGIMVLVREYRHMYPAGKVHIHALIACLIAMGCAASLVAAILWFSNFRP